MYHYKPTEGESDRNLEIMCMIDHHQGNLSDEEPQHGWLANKALILRKNFCKNQKSCIFALLELAEPLNNA